MNYDDILFQEKCENVGCTYNETATEDTPSFPKCFYPTTNFGYYVESIDSNGILQLVWRNKPMHPTQILHVSVQVIQYCNEIFRVVIKDPKQKRYEVPIDIRPKGAADLSTKLYDVQTSGIGEKFWLNVIRQSNNESLFDTRNTTLVFLDQFLEITSILPSDRFYGMPERGAPFARSMEYIKMPLFAHDNFPSPIGQNINLYSSQPFYMVVENNGDAHGVMIYNSNAMEVFLAPEPSVTLRAMGGIFDIYFFLGPTPLSVTKQLTDVIGKPFLPPYWSIGFHLCRYGYKSTEDTRATFSRNWEKGLPMDVQWQDIDYMDQKLIFTIDSDKFDGLKEFVESVQAKGVKYVIIVDPAVGYKKGFDVYERGHFEDVYIKNITGQDIIGKVWPGETVFPDFTNRKTHAWWKMEMIGFHDDLPYDGIWLDMNEPANFDSDGTHGSIYGCENNKINNPPYKPNTAGDTMYYKTLCLDAKQAWGIQRDLHNIYGLTETKATYDALKAKNDSQKPFIISRSTFLGSGKYGGHWLGDNESNWKHLRQSIIGILDFNLIGIPMTGADIGGFFGNATDELAIRWHQLGAWYPFCRNHNFEGSKDQDPAIYKSQTFAMIKRAIEIRYELIPYWYTQFYMSHKSGEPIMRATFQNYPQDTKLFSKDFDNIYTQFMIGKSILVCPVTTENKTETRVYLPTSSSWYKHMNGKYSKQPAGDQLVNVPYSELPYFIKGGEILFMQMEGQTTTLRRANPYKIVVCPDQNDQAIGILYIDKDLDDPMDYAVAKIHYTTNVISFSTVIYNNFTLENDSGKYGDIQIIGVSEQITSVTIGGEDLKDFDYISESNELIIKSGGISKTVTDSFVIEINRNNF